MNTLLMVCFAVFMHSIEAKVESLCENPVIYAADRLVNETVRLYRGYHYWELNGLPNIEANITGPYNIWYKDMAPIHKHTSIVTILYGETAGHVFKFEDFHWWSWDQNGFIPEYFKKSFGETNSIREYYRGEKPGFDAVIHNGNLFEPMLIALISEMRHTNSHHKMCKLYYYKTDRKFEMESSWRTSIFPNTSYGLYGFYGGLYSEHYPRNLTTAFSWPKAKAELDLRYDYNAYLFKDDKYCLRPNKLQINLEKRGVFDEDKEITCEKWRDNRELFGCYRSGESVRPQSTPLSSKPVSPLPSQTVNPDLNKDPIHSQKSFANPLNCRQLLIVHIFLLILNIL